MRKFRRAALVGAVTAITIASLVTPAIAANPARDQKAPAHRTDNRPGPLTARNDARRKAALELIRSGQASPNADGVVTLGEEKYVEAVVGGEARLFTILAEFGTQVAGRYGRVPGPAHDQIPVPNRETVDGQNNPDYQTGVAYDNFRAYNAVLQGGHLVSDFDQAYYDDLFFGPENSMQDFYLAQSEGAYTITGEVGNVSGDNEGWVQVPGNASLYGDNAIEDFGGSWRFIDDAGDAWYQDALAQHDSAAQVNAYLSQFDIWDRNDFDATVTSTRPTAISTTSRRFTPGKARMPAAARRAATQSGRTAGLSTRPTSARPGRKSTARTTSRVALASATAITGSATTPSRARTAASASSRTSTATISACPTCTRPTPARTERPSGRSCRPVHGSATAPRTSVLARTSWARGRSCSSAGSTSPMSFRRAKASMT